MVVIDVKKNNKWLRNQKISYVSDKTKSNFIYKNFCKKNKKYKKKIIKCGTIILNYDLSEILLVKNNYSNKWGAPKGHRNNNETYADCAKRETLEETSIKLQFDDNFPKIKVNSSYYFPIIAIKLNKNLVPYDKNEISEIKWFKIKDLENLDINYETKNLLKFKFNQIKQIINFRLRSI